ncbi:cyclin-dependent kinase regulatory subunit-domain-containing protein [Phlyctochytrium arcticum]|nr:cyclin-dependent kinase regulatory subunit-domain-containing protein [Phlyctochytrium arcticum]
MSQQRAEEIAAHRDDIYYSNRYSDATHEYRHVTLPKQIARYVPPNQLMSENEWRALGVQQSFGWTHYMVHGPEPHVLLFRRDKEPEAAQQQPTAPAAPAQHVKEEQPKAEAKVDGAHKPQARARRTAVGGMAG